MPLKLGILASGEGTNAQAIIDKINEGILEAEISVIISNNAQAGVLKRAKNAGISFELIEHKNFPARLAHEQAMIDALVGNECELIVLAGYMRILSNNFIAAFRNRIVNIHPALLPSFPGTRGAKDALEYGVKLTGPSVHFVEEVMDSGPLIIQAAIPVRDDDNEDSLKSRIHALEHRIYPQALQWMAEKRLSRNGRHISLKPGNKKVASGCNECFIWPPLEEGF